MTIANQSNVSDLDALSEILASLDDMPTVVDTQMKGIDSLLDDLETSAVVASTVTEESIVAEIESEALLAFEPTKPSIGDMEQVIIDLEASNTSVPPVVEPEIITSDRESVIPEVQEEEKVEVKLEEPAPKTEVKEKKKSSPRGARFSFDGKDEAFFEKAGLQREEFMKSYNEAPVKAMDKIQNIMHWFSGGPDLSVYTCISMHSLIADKSASSNSLKLAMMSHPEKPYPVGTASTQAGQMMAVFPALGIATKDGKSLTLNPESPIVKKFMAEQ